MVEQLNLLQRGDQSVHLEPKVMDVLCYLADHAGEVLNKGLLIQAVWPDTASNLLPARLPR